MLTFNGAKAHKKTKISDIFKILYLARNWLNDFEILIEYARDYF